MKKLLKFLSIAVIFLSLAGSAHAEWWSKGSNGQLYTNSGNGLGNAIINVGGCNGCGGGGGSPAAPDMAVQFNDSGSFGGNSNFTYEKSTGNFTVADETGTNLGLEIRSGGVYALGDLNSTFNGGAVGINDATQQAILGFPSTYINLDNLSHGGHMITMGNLSASVPDVPKDSPFPVGTPGFAGTGDNDMEWTGYYDGGVYPTSYTVTVDTVGNGRLAYSAGSGPFTVGETITDSPAGAQAEVVSDDGTTIFYTNKTFGSFVIGDTITGSSSGATATVDGVTEASDTFTWADSNGNSGGPTDIPATGSEDLSSAVKVSWGSPFNHAVGDLWTWGYTEGGGKMLSFDGTHFDWDYGDVEGLVKGQHVQLTYRTDPTDWVFSVGDSRGDFLHVNPIDAATAGKFWLGDHEQTNNGTAFFADDDAQTIGLETQYLGNEVGGIGMRGGSDLVVKLGDFNGTQNDTYVALSDQDRTITSHAGIGSGLDALTIDGPTMVNASTISGALHKVEDKANGDVGIAGAADLTAFTGSRAGAFMAHLDGPTSDVAEFVADNFGGSIGAYSYVKDGGTGDETINALGKGSQTLTYKGDQYLYIDAVARQYEIGDISGAGGGTFIDIDDAAQTISFNDNYAFPFLDGSNHQVLETDGAGTLSWVTPSGSGTIGGSIALDEIAVGSGTDTVAGSNNFRYVASTGVFQVKDPSGNKTLEITPASNLWKLGDIDALGAGTIFRIDNAAKVADIRNNAGVYLSLDMNAGAYSVGDISGTGHLTQMRIDDSSQYVDFISTAGAMLSLDNVAKIYSIGNLGSTGNRLRQVIDDGLQTIQWQVGASNKLILSFEPNNGIYQYGDLQGYKNSSQSIMADGTISSSNRYLQYQTLGKVFMKLDPGQKRYRVGDVGAENNGTLVDINDATAQQTVFLSGGLVQKGQYETPATGDTVTVAASTTVLTVNPAGALLALTIAFPASPANGRTVSFNCTQAITTLTLSGGTFVGGLTSLTAGAGATYVYSSGDSKWHYQP